MRGRAACQPYSAQGCVWQAVPLALPNPHRVGLAGAGLAIRDDGCIVPLAGGDSGVTCFASESKRAVGTAELHCAGCDGGYRAVAGMGGRV
jgi:hypothetical protein